MPLCRWAPNVCPAPSTYEDTPRHFGHCVALRHPTGAKMAEALGYEAFWGRYLGAPTALVSRQRHMVCSDVPAPWARPWWTPPAATGKKRGCLLRVLQ